MMSSAGTDLMLILCFPADPIQTHSMAGHRPQRSLPSRKLTWKPKKGPTKTTVLKKGAIWVSMLVWGSVHPRV